ncbi:copper amine oxidase [Ilyonectria destructans]|nr:copper amine oxidase [Ilyonectria destructans]
MFAKRCDFAHKPLHAPPNSDNECFLVGKYVCQPIGDIHPEIETIRDSFARDGSIENTNIVCYIQSDLEHFPCTEDFPIMPVDPVSVMMRAINLSRCLKSSSILFSPFRSPKANPRLSCRRTKDVVQVVFRRAACE